MNKLALGTVQFGLNYGINNPNGKIASNDILEIIKYCSENKIDTIDTAQAYGNSEEELGNAFCEINNPFKIVSKLLPSNTNSTIGAFNLSLQKLKQTSIYAFLYHDFTSYFQNQKSFESLIQLKNERKVEKIGFSLYFPKELEWLFENNIPIEIVQIPYNFFDRRFEPYFEELKKRNVEIHIRSIFLQGIFFMNPDTLHNHFDSVKNKLKYLNKIADENLISMSSLCLNFANLNPNIDKIVVGINNLENLKENLNNIKEAEKVSKILANMSDLREENEDIILPYKWNLK